MKRLAFLFLLLLGLCACAESGPIFPDYTDRAVDCRFSLTVDGTPYQLRVERAPLTAPGAEDYAEFTDATVTVLAPAALAGIQVRLSGGETYLVAGEMRIPAEREALGGFMRLVACFSCRNGQVDRVNTVSRTPVRTAVTYGGDYGPVTWLYGEGCVPVSVEFTYGGHVYVLTELTFS